MDFELSPQNLIDIRKHALSEYPKEACGMIVSGGYLPCVNYAADPEKDFEIAAAIQIGVRAKGLVIQAIVHSHPGGPLFPTESDMIGQISSALPWVLVATDGQSVSSPEIWGEGVAVAPIIGREFMHGIRDCYSLVRDVFRVGKDALKTQGIDWPFDPILLPDYARNDGWWGEPKRPLQNLYSDNFVKVGFKEIPRENLQPGDCFLTKVRSDVLNHAGILLPGNLILHHLPGRLSRREPAGLWSRAAETWVRYGDSIA